LKFAFSSLPGSTPSAELYYFSTELRDFFSFFSGYEFDGISGGWGRNRPISTALAAQLCLISLAIQA
jgi:hypothetical protein